MLHLGRATEIALILVAATAPLTLAAAFAMHYSVLAPSASRAPVVVYNSNWAGYMVNTTGRISSVVGSWNVPAVNCSTSVRLSSVWVGIDGVKPHDTVEQIGTTQWCQFGVTHYQAWYEVFPKPMIRSRMPVAPGDAITASVTYMGNGTFLLELADATNHHSLSVTVQEAAAARAYAEWIVEAPTELGYGTQPMPPSQPVTFTDCYATLNGQKMNPTNFDHQYAMSMLTDTGDRAYPTAYAGGSFTVTINALPYPPDEPAVAS